VVLTRRRSVFGVDGRIVGASKRHVRVALQSSGVDRAARTSTERYACPDCGDRSEFDGDCPRCEVALVDTSVAAPWQIDQHRAIDAVPWIDWLWTAVAVLSLLFSMLWSLRWHGPLAPWLLKASLFALMAFALRALSHAVASRALRGRRRSAAARRLREAPEVAIANAPEGAEARISGATTTLRRAYNPGQPASLAYERETRGVAVGNVLRSGGGEFVLDDGSGAQAIVRAQFVTVVGGVEVDGQRIVPEGARVEVVGACRWEVSASEGAVVHGRSVARVLRVEGSPDRPVILRVIDAPPAAQTGVRVAVDAVALDEDERHASASEGGRRRAR
jgi:hypothetical protein